MNLRPTGLLLCSAVSLFALPASLRSGAAPAPAASAASATPPATSARSAPKLPATFDVRAIDAYLSGQVQGASRVGLSVAILHHGRLVLSKGYGKRSLAAGRPPLDRLGAGLGSLGGEPVETNTLFAIGSVSKQFTCACILLLAEDGRLSVRDPVEKYYPQLTRAKDITLLDLMNHVSGYPDYYPLDFVDRRMGRAIEPDELLRQYAGGKLDFEPRSRWSYSNTGYILLGRVVEKVSGEPFGAFLERRVLRPLGLGQTVYEPAPTDQRLAGGYTTFALSDPESVGPEGAGWLGGAGGICSTPTDLAKWDLALMDGRLLKPESYALMTAPRTLSDGRVTDYGCGLSVRLQAGRQVVSHNGAVSGFNTWNSMIPSTRSAVIMTCNLDGGLGSLPRDVLSLLLREPGNVPAVKGPPAVEQVKTLFAQFRRGKVTRATFGEEFNQFLTDQKIAGAAARLKPYRSLQQAEVTNSHERGGMEVTVTRLTFRNGVLRALMYRRSDGKVEQFFLDHE